MACLVIESGEQEGTYFQLTKRPIAGGRDPATEIQILDPKASRRHFRIRMVDGDYIIGELKSRNGVLVNNVRITGECKLKNEDEIRIGDTHLVFYDHDDPDRSNAVEKFRNRATEYREDRTMGDNSGP